MKKNNKMKKIVSLLLVMIFTLFSVITTSALSEEPIGPRDYVYIYFRDYYSNVDEDAVTVLRYADFKEFYFFNSNDSNLYMAIKYTSANPVQEPYFNRFGENNEYYECSDVTNLLFESGITVFCGQWLSFPENHNDDFYTLEEILNLHPYAFDEILEYYGPQFVGKIGDANADGKITIIDATEIQRHIAKKSTVSNEKIIDVDNNGETTILDATAIQRKLAKIT